MVNPPGEHLIRCPRCGRLHRVPRATVWVTCAQCGKCFGIAEPEPAPDRNAEPEPDRGDLYRAAYDAPGDWEEQEP
jgi:DNA-directed RNA polymerase subunit RPC12/RpoP